MDKKSSYLTVFACQYCKYRHARLLFGANPARDMFQKKIDMIFKELPNVFGIVDGILIVNYAEHTQHTADMLKS